MAFPTVAARNNSQRVTNGTSHTVALPDGISTGDLVIVAFGLDAVPAITPPTDWTNHTLANGDGNACRLGWLVKVIDGTEGFDGTGDTITVTTGTSQHSSHRSWRIAAGTFDPDSAVFTSINGAAGAGTSTTPDPPNLDPADWGAEDTLWLAGFCADANGTVSDFPDDFTNTFSDNTGSAGDGVALGVAERELNASSLDPTTFTQSLSQEWVAATLAIRPAAAGAQTVSPALIDHSATLFAPSPLLEAEVGLVDHSASVFAPSATLRVVPALIDHSASVFAPAAALAGAPGLLDHSGALFAPSLTHQVVMPLIDHSGVVFSPTNVDDGAGAGGGGSDKHFVRMRRRSMRSLQKGGM